jgi:hypothetical protein
MKISSEQAQNEVINFLQLHDIETDFDKMNKQDADDLRDMIAAIAKPISAGRALIDGNKYTLTLRKPQGDLISVTVNGLSAADMFASDKAKNNSEMSKTGQIIASMIKIPFAQVGKLTAQDFMLLSKISTLFIVV